MSEINQNVQQVDSLDQIKDRVMVENNAQTIFDHLTELENEPRHQRRWIWELLQNAQDTSLDKPVNVNINWDGSNLKFSHDGQYFTEKEITHLIFHGTTKNEQEGKTGKFGTGFMTTHLLSRRVNISGKIQDGRLFNFILDRSGNNAGEIANTLDLSWSNFKGSIKKNDNEHDENKTVFTYLNLTSDGITTVQKVLSKSSLLILPVLVFANKIESITIENEEKVITFKREDCNKPNKVRVVIEQKSKGECSVLNFLTHTLPDGDSKIVLPLDNEEKIAELDNEIPRLFITFPLIGTEKATPLPFLVHSSSFEPSSEREKNMARHKRDRTIKNK